MSFFGKIGDALKTTADTGNSFITWGLSGPADKAGAATVNAINNQRKKMTRPNQVQAFTQGLQSLPRAGKVGLYLGALGAAGAAGTVANRAIRNQFATRDSMPYQTGDVQVDRQLQELDRFARNYGLRLEKDNQIVDPNESFEMMEQAGQKLRDQNFQDTLRRSMLDKSLARDTRAQQADVELAVQGQRERAQTGRDLFSQYRQMVADDKNFQAQLAAARASFV